MHVHNFNVYEEQGARSKAAAATNTAQERRKKKLDEATEVRRESEMAKKQRRLHSQAAADAMTSIGGAMDRLSEDRRHEAERLETAQAQQTASLVEIERLKLQAQQAHQESEAKARLELLQHQHANQLEVLKMQAEHDRELQRMQHQVQMQELEIRNKLLDLELLRLKASVGGGDAGDAFGLGMRAAPMAAFSPPPRAIASGSSLDRTPISSSTTSPLPAFRSPRGVPWSLPGHGQAHAGSSAALPSMPGQ
ncbi:MAG: hypothetical protein ACK4ZJ_03905 [Allorhizobium sp.]